MCRPWLYSCVRRLYPCHSHPAQCAAQPSSCTSVPLLRKSWGEGRVQCECPLVTSVFQHREQRMAHSRCSVSIRWFIHACNYLRIFNDCWACIWHFALAETHIKMYSLFTKTSHCRGVNRLKMLCRDTEERPDPVQENQRRLPEGGDTQTHSCRT